MKSGDIILIWTTVTMPAQLGQSVTVTCALDDTPTALLPGETGTRDDAGL